jgi:glycosyltransferase involved in cell wall biosynthesis
MLSVIIPASNEARYLGACLEALLAQDLPARGPAPDVEIIVAANACVDDTVPIARSFEKRVAERGWRLKVLDLVEKGKPNALNRGDAAASGEVRVFLDADVAMSPPLLGQLAETLDRPAPAYASGRLVVAPARSRITRAYARIWSRLPFTEGVTGAGLFAVNAAGRRRWKAFPAIISDDTFVRLSFRPEERFGVPAPYAWPMVEGFANLVRVRRRQDVGVAEVARLYPDLMGNDDKLQMKPSRLLRLVMGDPVGAGVYAAVSLLVRLTRKRSGEAWSRGR